MIRNLFMTESAVPAWIGFIWYESDVTGAPSGGTVIFRGIKEDEPKPVLDVENLVWGLGKHRGHVVDHSR